MVSSNVATKNIIPESTFSTQNTQLTGQSTKTAIKYRKEENQSGGISIFHDHLASAQATGNKGKLDGEERRVCHRIDLQMRLCHRVKAP